MKKLFLSIFLFSFIFLVGTVSAVPEGYSCGYMSDGSPFCDSGLACEYFQCVSTGVTEEPPEEHSDDGNCNPDSGYDYCYFGSYTYGPATAYAKVQKSEIQGTYRNGYYVGPTYIRYKMSGDKFYKGINQDWDPCNENGCSSLSTIASSGNFQLTSNPGDHWTDCMYFMAWDRNDNSGYWAWTRTGYGWTGSGNCLNIKQVECYDNSDCGLNSYCEKSGDWTTWNCQDYECMADSDCAQGYFCDKTGTIVDWSCELKICDEGEERCFGSNLQKCENNQWVDKGIILNKCGVLCLEDSDCPENEVSDKFCSGNNIMETRTDNYCFTDHQCDYSIQDVILETCSFKCEDIAEEDAICIDKICDEGEMMCSEEGNALICQSNQWGLKEECDYGCEEGWCKSFYTTNKFYGIIAGSIASLILLVIIIVVFTSKKKKRK